MANLKAGTQQPAFLDGVTLDAVPLSPSNPTLDAIVVFLYADNAILHFVGIFSLWGRP